MTKHILYILLLLTLSIATKAQQHKKKPRQAIVLAKQDTSAVVKTTQLKEVAISTGYQTISGERLTGSFVQVDNELLNRTVSPDILSRLKDVVPGVFSRGGSNIKIRGESTIFAQNDPLIILDNFPFEGDVTNINPNDIENITILKDAAAASIWGARAGNGVIVITTKKGRYNKALQININSSINIGQKPDLFSLKRMSVPDYIETERRLFNEKFYQSTEVSANKAALSPVIELLIANRDGQLSNTDLEAQLNHLKSIDVRDDFNKYFNRNSIDQQYSIGINGGSEKQRYSLSGGYDRNLASAVGNSYNRISINAANTYAMLKQKLEISTGIYYIQSENQVNNPGSGSIRMSAASGLYPYAKLADENGNPLSIIKDYRPAFINTAMQAGLLNWQYMPLEEISLADNRSKSIDLRINAGLKYKIIKELNAELLYQYSKGLSIRRNHQSQETYYTRDQINRLTQVNLNGTFVRPIPLGGILDLADGETNGHNARAQLNFTKSWNTESQLNMMAGTEISSQHSFSHGSRLYGYDDEHAVAQLVNYISTTFPLYYNPLTTTGILNGEGLTDLTNNFVSWYANASYSYKNYTLSASGRKDQSNLFGVNTNQKGVPLWSAGLNWDISKAAFYKSAWLPSLKLRASFGYNGNVDKSVTAFTTAILKGVNAVNQQPYSEITNPPNPELRWEKVRIMNLGIDFGTKNQVFTGTIEYYTKQGLALIGNTPFPPSSGILNFRGNTANTKGTGLDLSLNTRILKGPINWGSNFFMSLLKDEVSKYLVVSNATNYVQGGTGGLLPLEGKSLTSIFSYPSAGLDPATGDPQGYLNGVVSKEYLKIFQAANPNTIHFHGNTLPRIYGAFRNNFNWKSFSLSASISYKLKYYFRNSSIIYGNEYGLSNGNGDIYKRWQKSGDEAFTSVPSMPSVANANRDVFYTYSSDLVLKGDHIRLQDVRLGYTLNKTGISRIPVQRIQLFFYVNNLCLLWTANKEGIDPDFRTGKPSKTFAFGLKADL